MKVVKRHSDRGQSEVAFVIGGIAVVVVGLIALVWLGIFVTGWKSTPPDKIALHYTGGPFQGVHFKEVVPPGTHTKFYGLLENFYKYPSTQRNYIVSSVASEGDRGTADFIQTTSSDRIEADWNMVITFKLNTDPQVIKQFHNQLGLKFHAWTDKGWDHLLDQSLRQVLENKMNTEVSKYTIDQLYSDPATRLTIQDAVGKDLKDGVNQLVGGNFFCGPTFDPSRPTICPDLKFLIKGRPGIPESLRNQYAANRTAELAVIQKDYEVQQAKKQAEAAAALTSAISNNPNYVLLKAIESGKITFWVLPSGGGNNFTFSPPQK